MLTLKRFLYTFGFIIVLNGCSSEDSIRSGDIIFQTSKSEQSLAISLVTKSFYTNVGVILQDKDGKYYVYETIGAVVKTPLGEFIEAGDSGKFAVMRVKQFTHNNKSALKDAITKHMGKSYDYLFQWDDNKLYSSEFVYKVFKDAIGVELGEFSKFGDYDLSGEEVTEILDKHFPNGYDKDEPVLSPEALSKALSVELIYSNFPVKKTI